MTVLSPGFPSRNPVAAKGESGAPAGPDLAMGRPLRIGLWSLVVLFGILGLWSALTPISGAVIAQGQVIVEGKPLQVQSLEGGRVVALHVRNGDPVHQGQVLAEFDPAPVATALDIARARLADALALRARLVAEQQGLAAPDFTAPDLPFAAPDLTAQAAGQRQIFAARAAVLAGQKQRLAETQAQYAAQLDSLAEQIAAKHAEIALTEAEIATQQALLDQGLARQGQLTELRRSHAALLGARAALAGEQSRLRNAYDDSALESLQAERSFREQVVTDLRATDTAIEELTLEIATRSAELARLDIRAPVDGIVHELQLTAAGSIVAPGGTLMAVIPMDQGVEFDLSVDPRAIDQVHVGQEAEVVISSFDPRSVPRLKGRVTGLSPDAVVDPRTGRSFYRVMLRVPPAELDRLGDLVPMPGMPVEAYLATAERSVLSYLLHPLTVHLARAFREE